MKKTNQQEEVFIGDFIVTVDDKLSSVSIPDGVNGIIIRHEGSMYLCRLQDGTPHCSRHGKTFRNECGIYLSRNEFKLA